MYLYGFPLLNLSLFLKVRIVVCEPRRLAAVTVATRVAQERDEKLGQVVSKTPQLFSNFSQIK
jgi:HrpA-like RNA helicase